MINNKFVRIRIALLIPEKDKILLVKHKKNNKTYWLLPGGGVEYGYSIHDTAKKELKEELNMEVIIGDLLYISEGIAPDKSKHILQLVFKAKGISKPSLGNDPQVVDFCYKEVDLLQNLDLRPPMAEYIQNSYKLNYMHSPLFLGNLWV